jgi:hypothetical protein
VLATNDVGNPTNVAPEDTHVVLALDTVDMITYLAPSKAELAAGIVIANDVDVVPVKYVLVLVIVYSVSTSVATICGDAFNANKDCTLKLTVLPDLDPNTVLSTVGVTTL